MSNANLCNGIRMFVCRVAPKGFVKNKPRGTLISPLYSETFEHHIVPDQIVLEFGQPPTEGGKLEIKCDDVVILLIGSDDPNGSSNTRGIIGLATVNSASLAGSGPSARCEIKATVFARLQHPLTNSSILKSRYFTDSHIEDIRIFGLTTSPQAHNCVRFHVPQEDSEIRDKRLIALLKILKEFEPTFIEQIKFAHPELSALISKGSKIFDFPDEEETVDGLKTGVAKEQGETANNLGDPYDPNLIRVDAKMFSLQNVVDMIEDNDIDLAPDFQRRQVWNEVQKCRLIESILLRIPLPAFYFSASEDGRFSVVDGLQRLSTIKNFMSEKQISSFKLDKGSLEYLRDQVGGKNYEDLKETLWGRRIKNTQILVNIIDPQTPFRVKFDIFKRINTGGSPLEPQEIRHCMSGQKSRALLKECAESEEFNFATSGILQDHPRMVDREFILRFMAFKMMQSYEEYASARSMDEFLTEATRKLDSKQNSEIESLKNDFLKSMHTAYLLFSDHAFRKWPASSERLFPINRALFESWAVALSECENTIEMDREQIVMKARLMMEEDTSFLEAISTSTGSIQKVKIRFEKVRSLLKELL
jgi:hypothetical protein